jgi:branched-chain amino acid transport system permease protein
MMPSVVIWRMLPVAVGIALALLVPPLLSPYALHLCVMVGIFAILTLSLNLICGWAGMISLGHAGFWLIGAYTTALLCAEHGVSFWLGLVASIALTALSGLLLGLPSLRWNGHFLAVITIAFGLIVQTLSVNWEWLTNGNEGVSNIPRPSLFGYRLTDNLAFYYLVIAMTAVVCGLMQRFIASGYGRALKALRDDEEAAACMGVNVARFKVLAFVLSAGLAGMAGALYASYVRFLNPDSFSLDISIRVFVMVVIGGIGSIGGSILGSFTVYVLPEVLRPLQQFYYVIWGIVVIVVMLFLPGGLASVWTRIQPQRDTLQ